MDVEKKAIAAAQRGDVDALSAMVAEGANINKQDEQGWTALHWSAGKGDLEAINFLLEHQADITLTGRDNRTPFMVAQAAGHREAGSVLASAEKAKRLVEGHAAKQTILQGLLLEGDHAVSALDVIRQRRRTTRGRRQDCLSAPGLHGYQFRMARRERDLREHNAGMDPLLRVGAEVFDSSGPCLNVRDGKMSDCEGFAFCAV
jgi:hypothetical protein